MSAWRTCVSCRTAKTKCDYVRPSCGRCAQKGLICSGLPLQDLFNFRNENDVAKRNSQRVRKQKPAVADRSNGLNPSLEQYRWWFGEYAMAEVPGTLKRDIETRVIERFLVNWVLNPSETGVSEGYMHDLPTFLASVEPDNVLSLAVRAVAFADVRNERIGGVPFHLKARQYYGAALASMRVVISDEAYLRDDRILAAMLLIDNFEVMYLARNDPFSAHTHAIRHLLQTRGRATATQRGCQSRQAATGVPSRFSLWRMTHYRLQAWQTLARERPDAHQVAWLYKLHAEPDDLRICSHVLHMNVYSAAAKTLTESEGKSRRMGRNGAGGGDRGEDVGAAKKLEQATKLIDEMQSLLVVVERWAPEMARVWNVEEGDVADVPEWNDGIDGSQPWFPIPRFPHPRLLTYDDIWLAYIWNFYAASQIVLRESLVEVVEYAAGLRGEHEPNNTRCVADIVGTQCRWVDALSGAILKSVPQLLGFACKRDGGVRGPRLVAQQGRMAGRLFALFSMWVIQRARFTPAEHKKTASDVVGWINSRHELG